MLSTIFIPILLILSLTSPVTSISISPKPPSSASHKDHTHNPTVYIIRHAENSPKHGDKGLSPKGEKRAECLREVFGRNTSEYDIGYIIVPRISSKQHRHRRPYDTVHPLARDLGLDIDASCKPNRPKCVARRVRDFKGPGNILISWRHSIMPGILEGIGKLDGEGCKKRGRGKGKKGDQVPDYPKTRYDIIWTLPYPYHNITDVSSEKCLDSDTDTFESDSESEFDVDSEIEWAVQI